MQNDLPLLYPNTCLELALYVYLKRYAMVSDLAILNVSGIFPSYLKTTTVALDVGLFCDSEGLL